MHVLLFIYFGIGNARTCFIKKGAGGCRQWKLGRLLTPVPPGSPAVTGFVCVLWKMFSVTLTVGSCSQPRGSAPTARRPFCSQHLFPSPVCPTSREGGGAVDARLTSARDSLFKLSQTRDFKSCFLLPSVLVLHFCFAWLPSVLLLPRS